MRVYNFEKVVCSLFSALIRSNTYFILSRSCKALFICETELHVPTVTMSLELILFICVCHIVTSLLQENKMRTC